MTPGVLVADQKHRRVIDQRATHALAARRAESCDQQHIVSSLKSSTTTSSALNLRHNLAFSDSNPGILPSRHLPERAAMFVTLAVRLCDVLPRRDKLYFRQPCGLFHPTGEPISHGQGREFCGMRRSEWEMKGRRSAACLQKRRRLVFYPLNSVLFTCPLASTYQRWLANGLPAKRAATQSASSALGAGPSTVDGTVPTEWRESW
jgi:hypothetical protein